jgi:hypothetical protein
MSDQQPDDPSNEPESADIDRAFAELVANFEHTPEPATSDSPEENTGVDPDRTGQNSSDERSSASPWRWPGSIAAGDQPVGWRTSSGPAAGDPDEWDFGEDADPDEGKPETPPWPQLSLPALLGWLGIFLGIATMIIAALGMNLPAWAGWLAIAAFVGGFGLLLSRLPRNRPPGSGDGACL